jgi:glycosyltransferase involved in cell wall biosynthesis
MSMESWRPSESTPASDVTIVIATNDRPDWLSVAIRSIQLSAEVARPFGVSTHVVVVDNGGNPRTPMVCASLGVRYVQHTVRVGRRDASASRVLGLDGVQSDYCGFFDDDDVMLPRFIKLHVDALRAGNDVAYSAFNVVDEDLCPVRAHRQGPMYYGDLLFDHNMVNDHCLWRHETVSSAFDDALEFMMPFGAWLELAHQGRQFLYIDEPCYLYRRHSANARNAAAIDPETARARSDLVNRYRRLVVERDGRCPRPSARLRARRAVPPTVRRLARQMARGRV